MPTQVLERPNSISAPAKSLTLTLLVLAAIVGLLQAGGWLFQWPEVLDFHPGTSKMSFHTAVCTLISAFGISALLLPRSIRLVLALSVMLLTLASLSFFKGVLGVGFTLNDFVTNSARSMGMVAVTSSYTSFALLLISLVVLLYTWPQTRRLPALIGILGVAVSAIGFAGIAAHLLEIMPSSGVSGLASLAFPTSLSLSFLGLAIVTIEISRYAKKDFSWAPAMSGTLALVITLMMWQALDNVPNATEVFPHYFLIGGIFLSLLVMVSTYSAIIAHQNLELARTKEHELLELNSQLERKVKERTRELASSNAELEQFASMAAHDLKSPINSMTQFAEALKEDLDGRLTPDEKQYLNFITRAGDRARRLIDSLLNYAKSGSRSTSYEIIDASSIARAAEENLHFDTVTAAARIEISALPTVCGDRIQLTQLFQNLLANAIKFRVAGQTPYVRVTAAEEATDWRFSVTDNGIGIPEEKATKIFEIFSRLHSEEEYPGSGLGLAMCRRIVENHSGRIWVESQPRKGTTFFFTLPKVGSSQSRC